MYTIIYITNNHSFLLIERLYCGINSMQYKYHIFQPSKQIDSQGGTKLKNLVRNPMPFISAISSCFIIKICIYIIKQQIDNKNRGKLWSIWSYSIC